MLQQMMARKSRTMEEIMDGMIREDFVRLQREAQSMKYYGTLINHFLAFPEYEKLSVEFDQSLDDLSDTAARKDASAAQEAVLRLQRSCIECHVILNQRMRSS